MTPQPQRQQMLSLFHQLPTLPRPSLLAGLVSLGCHGALFGMIFVGITADTTERDERMMEFVTYLVPPDQVRGGEREGAGSIAWEGTGQGGGGEGETPGVPEGTGPAGPATSPEAGGGPPDDGPTLQELLAAIAGDSILTQLDVDSTVARYPGSAAPAYPPNLLAEQIEGSAFVLYVVDTTGQVDTSSVKVIRTTHPDFVTAVKAALPDMLFRPAILRGTKVRQLVQQSFAFRITPPAPPAAQRPPDSLPPSV